MTIDRRLLAGALGLALRRGRMRRLVSRRVERHHRPRRFRCGGHGRGRTDRGTRAHRGGWHRGAGGERRGHGGTEPSFVAGAASDLEAMLPNEAGGVKYQKSSFDGASLGMLGGSIDTTELDPILKANGKTINDVRVAIAAPVDSASTEAGMVIAFQIRGVDATKFMAAMGADTAELTKTSIGGKDVSTSGAGGFGVIVYPKDDVLFEVLMASDKVGEAIVSQLP